MCDTTNVRCVIVDKMYLSRCVIRCIYTFVCFYVSFPEQQASKERSNARFVYTGTQNDHMFALVHLVSGSCYMSSLLVSRFVVSC